MTHIAILARRHVQCKAPGIRILDLPSLARQRRALSCLDDHLLKDIGLTRTETRNEAGRSIWDAPDNWNNT